MNHRFLYPIVISSLAIAIMATTCAAPTPTIIPTITNPFDEKVDVGSHALRIRCTGQGSLTVVVETGFGEPGVGGETSSWKNLANEIEKTTRICVYDRAGFWIFYRSRIRARPCDIIENIVDIAHFPHVHGGAVQSKIASGSAVSPRYRP